jgi:hypothetical protein
VTGGTGSTLSELRSAPKSCGIAATAQALERRVAVRSTVSARTLSLSHKPRVQNVSLQTFIPWGCSLGEAPGCAHHANAERGVSSHRSYIVVHKKKSFFSCPQQWRGVEYNERYVSMFRVRCKQCGMHLN